LLLSFTLLPVCLARIPHADAANDRLSDAWDRALQLIVRVAERRGALILVVSGLLLFLSGPRIARLDVDVDERELFGENNEVVRWAEFVEEHLRRSDTLEIELVAP